MNRVKFYRVETLPETGEIGGLYFVYGGDIPLLYICTEENSFEIYTHVSEVITNEEIDSLFEDVSLAAYEKNSDGDNTYTVLLPTGTLINNGIITL